MLPDAGVEVTSGRTRQVVQESCAAAGARGEGHQEGDAREGPRRTAARRTRAGLYRPRPSRHYFFSRSHHACHFPRDDRQEPLLSWEFHSATGGMRCRPTTWDARTRKDRGPTWPRAVWIIGTPARGGIPEFNLHELPTSPENHIFCILLEFLCNFLEKRHDFQCFSVKKKRVRPGAVASVGVFCCLRQVFLLPCATLLCSRILPRR